MWVGIFKFVLDYTKTKSISLILLHLLSIYTHKRIFIYLFIYSDYRNISYCECSATKNFIMRNIKTLLFYEQIMYNMAFVEFIVTNL